MTGRPAIPGVDISNESIQEAVKAVKEIKGISRVVFDLTTKPPATTEWE